MKQIASLAVICAALLFVSLCVGLMTAGPAIAQGGGGTNKDVRVINTAAEAIPATITNVPTVQISGTPTVNVGTPNVNVLTVPAVQVGNGVGNPVPVNVTNVSAVQTQALVEQQLVVSAGATHNFPIFDSSAYEKVRVVVRLYSAASVRVTEFIGGQPIAYQELTDFATTTTNVFEVPGTTFAVNIRNISDVDAIVAVGIYAR